MQFLKPVHHVSLRDWESAYSRLQETVESSRLESWRMRQEYTQLRNEVGHEGRWDQFYIRAALQDRQVFLALPLLVVRRRGPPLYRVVDFPQT